MLSDTEVKQLCRQYLVCQLEEQKADRATTEELAPAGISPQKVPALSTPATLPSTANSVAIPEKIDRPPNFIVQMLNSLIAEISIVWLLFLGVFMVVVSSGVLAASQWERFPAAGQYGVLLAYTLIFWAIGSWANKQQNLQLTAQTLQGVTLLLVPYQFLGDGYFWIVAVSWRLDCGDRSRSHFELDNFENY
ncbi:hypothetical protein HC766_07495 [Candidatus Gracilibacteria bacterium]|nr:hypothetical protein [Candidatus Gracilibacteria bacterium]